MAILAATEIIISKLSAKRMMMQNIADYIEDIKDFPKTGVNFKDISPLLRDKMPELIEFLASKLSHQVDAICGIESRGFILGAALAQKMNKGFIPIRKKGKLPPPVISESYQLEYGEDCLEIKSQTKSLEVILIDDVLATGGTLHAAINLCQKANLKVEQIAVLINLKFLNQFESKCDIPLISLLNYS
jgi:adenine phosphoribosyltransferase